jgi:hypothetical protein
VTLSIDFEPQSIITNAYHFLPLPAPPPLPQSFQVSDHQGVAVIEYKQHDRWFCGSHLNFTFNYFKFQEHHLVQMALFLWGISLMQPITLLQILALKRQILNL